MQKSTLLVLKQKMLKMPPDKMNMYLDIKDIRKITKFGRILEAKHVPIVMLEFWIDTISQYYKKFLNESFNFIFNCPSDWGTTFAALATNNIGLLNTSNLIGSYNRWLELNDPTEEAR